MNNINTLLITSELQLSGFNYTLLNILSIIAILTAILVILSKNPIISVLYLIGLFVGMAIYLVSIGISFLGLSYLLVYVGAVSILFLFILMLINVRISELVSDTNNTIPLILVTTLAFSLLASDVSINTQSIFKVKTIILEMFTDIFKNNSVQDIASFSWDNTIANLNHINSIGNIMYSSHNILLLQVSLILLLAMVGAIVITIKPTPKGKFPVLQ